MHAFLHLNLSATAHDVLCHNVRWICLVSHSVCSHTPALSLTPSFVNKKNNGLAGYYTYPPSECMFYDTPARCPRDPVRFVKAYYGKSALGGAVGHDTFYNTSGGAWSQGQRLGRTTYLSPMTRKGDGVRVGARASKCHGWCGAAGTQMLARSAPSAQNGVLQCTVEQINYFTIRCEAVT